MRILYAIQGTGNGHLSRAMELIPHFQRRAKVDVLLSGTQCELELPFPVRYRFHGLSFIFGKKGGIDMMATYATNRVRRFMREVNSLPVWEYDLVVSDFEPVACWACYIHGLPCVGLSNQAALLLEGVPRAEVIDPVGKLILSRYAPVTANYGFHFQRYHPDITTPIIRQEVRRMPITDRGHYTVYLPAHDEEKTLRMLTRLPQVEWDVFCKHAHKESRTANVRIRPVSGHAFLESMASSSGVLCAAGFGTAAEALYLRKKLCVIPMKGQYEQQCNAVALAGMGCTVLPSFKKKHLPRLGLWLAEKGRIRVNYPDNADELAGRVICDAIIGKATGLEKRLLAGAVG